ncbi:DoxX family protein [Bdellovibrio bacteriovorus]|uniref:DoxX family protein n=1 Tax=Bdellovibrio bacteriovorus TaxID=959 RepID=UPI0035A72E99
MDVYNGHIYVNIGNMKKLNAFYRMLIVFCLLALGAKVFGFLQSWKEVPLWVMIQMFLFAGISHFTPLRHEFAKMIPPAIPWKMFWVYLTGVLEIVGAIDLIDPVTRPYAAWALIVFLILVFPANYYAAKNEIRFRGAKPPSALARGSIQILFIVALYIGGIL